MAKSALTQQDIDQLGWLLHQHDDRTAFYLHYYELTGNAQVLAMAKISQLTDYVGAVAQRGNEVVQEEHPDAYPSGGVFQFSHEVAPHLYDSIVHNFAGGAGTGVISERDAVEAAREAWNDRGLGEQFLGNPLLAIDRAEAFDFKGAWDAFDSDGTVTAFQAAIYAAIPDISGQPDSALQSRLENASYHVTEDGKVGFYVDRDTGLTVAVFDRPADQSLEPPIESRGVLSTAHVPEHPDLWAPTYEPAPSAPATGDTGPWHDGFDPYEVKDPFSLQDALLGGAVMGGIGHDFAIHDLRTELADLQASVNNLAQTPNVATDVYSPVLDLDYEPQVAPELGVVSEPWSIIQDPAPVTPAEVWTSPVDTSPLLEIASPPGLFQQLTDIFGLTPEPAPPAFGGIDTPPPEPSWIQEVASPPSLFQQVADFFTSPPSAPSEPYIESTAEWSSEQEVSTEPSLLQQMFDVFTPSSPTTVSVPESTAYEPAAEAPSLWESIGFGNSDSSAPDYTPSYEDTLSSNNSWSSDSSSGWGSGGLFGGSSQADTSSDWGSGGSFGSSSPADTSYDSGSSFSSDAGSSPDFSSSFDSGGSGDS